MQPSSSASTLTPCAPTTPAAPYLGGKRLLANRIIQRLAAIPHITYAEPFVGMGGVFLRRPFRAKAEVINDLSCDVSTLFRVLQRHYEALMDMLRWQITSRDQFERLRMAEPGSLTDLERAARFIYLQRTAFGGKIEGRNFGISIQNPGRFDVTKLALILDAIHQRLSGVVIERLHYAELLRRYDHPNTLFYLDPPYWGCEDDYGSGVFSPADHYRLADLLASLRGHFLLSINDHPEVRRVFAAFQIETVHTSYSIHAGPSKRVSELLITRRAPG